MIRYFAFWWMATFSWAQSDDALKKAKQEAEILQLSARPAVAASADGLPSLAKKRAAEAMHAAVFAVGATGRVVKNKPYAAEAITETVQPLIDGNRIIRTNVTKHYRDGEGRTRREQTIQNIEASRSMATIQLIVISDPMSKFDYAVDDARMTVRKFPRIESVASAEKADAANESSLGTRMIQGVDCTGTRKVRTIPAGQIGNVLPIEIVTENWYSAAIEALVRSTSSDPRFGQTTYTLRNVTLDEPPRQLFEPPPGYKLEFEGRAGTVMNRP